MADEPKNIFKKLEPRDSIQFRLLLERFAQLEEEYTDARTNLTFKGKTLAQANNDQAEWPIYTDERLGELKSICKRLETVVEMVRGTIVRELKGSALDLGRELARYVDRDDRYLDAQERLLMFDELREKYDALSDAWTTRGYALKNRVDMLVHQVKDNLI
jgi:hypothetical protein